MRFLGRCGVALLSLALLAGSAWAAGDSTGLTVFRSRCMMCHGEDGAGKNRTNTKMHPANLRSKEVQSLGDRELYETIAYGAKHHEYPHAFLYTGLTQKQIEAVVAFIRTLK